MTPTAALAFVRKHGLVLASGRGPAPSLAEAIAGEPIRGSWWGHVRGKEIFRALEQVSASPDVLVCRLIDGKITFVHRRLWPALARVARSLPARRVSEVRQSHTAAGHHVSRDRPFPEWVPAEVLAESRALSDEEALRALGLRPSPAPRRRVRSLAK